MSAIPAVTKKHVLAAITDIKRHGVPRGRGSTKFSLVFDGEAYPPKYVISLAAEHAVGRALRSDEFSGGSQTNDILIALGFTVVGPGGKRVAISRRTTSTALPKPTKQPRVERKASPAAPARAAPSRKPTTKTQQADHVIGRVVMRGRTPDAQRAGEAILLDVLTRRWPSDRRVKFLITPGGFTRASPPRTWSPRRTSWQSRVADLVPLTDAAERILQRVVTPKVYAAASGKVSVLTIGIDFWDESSRDHCELVAMFDVGKRKLVRWTGKSYPTGRQEGELFQVSDLGSHLLNIENERVLVLGCHDLNMWSPRGWANMSPKSVRRQRCAAMRKIASNFDPTVVLQHPHSTDTPNIWSLPWGEVQRQFPNLKAWASGISYFNWNGQPRAALGKVLERTAGDGGLDIVVKATDYG